MCCLTSFWKKKRRFGLATVVPCPYLEVYSRTSLNSLPTCLCSQLLSVTQKIRECTSNNQETSVSSHFSILSNKLSYTNFSLLSKVFWQALCSLPWIECEHSQQIHLHSIIPTTFFLNCNTDFPTQTFLVCLKSCNTLYTRLHPVRCGKYNSCTL